MVVDCAVTVGLVGTVCVRPEQHLSGGEAHLSARGVGGLIGHRGSPGTAVFQEAVVERPAGIQTVGAGLFAPDEGAATREFLLDDAATQVLFIRGGCALGAGVTPYPVDAAALVESVGSGALGPVGALTVGEGDRHGLEACLFIGGQAAVAGHVGTELVVQTAVGHYPVRPVCVRPVDGFAVAELLGVYAVAEVVFGPQGVTVEVAVTVPCRADAGADVD